jgi:glycogen synthase
MRKHMNVSVIINTLNRAKLLSEALGSLEMQTYAYFEVIVVKGPCEDNTDEVLKSFNGAIKTLTCQKTNLSMSRNLGICAAAGDIVAFMDDDAVADPAWVEELERGFDSDEVAAVGGWVYDHTGATFQCKYNICNRFATTRRGIDFDSTDILSYPGAFWFPSTIGTNTSFRRSILLEIGGFDEAYIYNCDETDVCLRLVDRGYRIAISPRALVYHRYAASYLRDDRKVPITLYPSALCKSYFTFRNGMPATSPQRAYRELSKFEEEVRRNNNWFYNSGWIPKERYEELQSDIRRGLHDGMVKALTNAERELIKPGNIDELTSPFLQFRAKGSTAGRLRVCLLSVDYPPGAGVGGIGRWTRLLAQGLERLGHEVHVLTLGEEHDTVVFESNVWVHRLVKRYQPHKRINLPFELPRSIVDIALTLKAEVDRCSLERPFDVISAPIWEHPGLALLTDRNNRYPLIISLHSAYGLIQPFKKDWHESLPYYTSHVAPMITAERWTWRNAPAVLGNSHVIIQEYEHAFGKRIKGSTYRVPHGTEIPKVNTARYDNDLDEMGAIKILYVGRLEKRKGIDLLLDAASIILSKNLDVKFTIVGAEVMEDPLFPGYQASFAGQHADKLKIVSRVTFTGPLPDEDVQNFYGGCDIFVAPSRFESFGLIFVEAMAHEKPVIALDVGGAREIITHRSEGLLVAPDRADALADAIELLVRDHRLRRRMAKKAGEKFRQYFTTNRMATEIVQTYVQFLGGRKLRKDFAKSGAPRG